MAWYDSITSVFSSSDSPPQDSSSTNSEQPTTSSGSWWPFSPSTPTFQVDPNQMLSSNYALKDFLQTNQQLSQPNNPNTQEEIDNLTVLADVKEQLDNTIGHSTILSGFRTKELENVLTAKGEPTAAGTSYHELGRAMDIAPVGMSITEFFGKLLASPLRPLFAEIAIKPSQNAIHLAVNTPSDMRDPKVLGLNSQGEYARLTADDILSYIKPYVSGDAAAVADTLANSGGSNTLLYAGLIGIGALILLGTKKSRRT